MTANQSIINQLNLLKYSKKEFLEEKNQYTLNCSDNLSELLIIIKNNIKKSGGNNSPFGNKYNSNYRKTEKYSNDKNKSTSKSWRLTKTKIISSDLSEKDKKQNEINSLLNKLSPKNYNNITKKIVEFYSNDTYKSELINNTIDNIFLKAVMQPVYCPYYVKFLKVINDNYNKHEIINKKCIEFKEIINPEHLKDKMSDKKIDEKQLSEQDKYDLFCKSNKEKTYKEGYSQFIGELYNKKIINDTTLDDNISYFVDTLEKSSLDNAKSSNVEDLLICICKMFITVYKTDTQKILNTYCNRIYEIKKNKDLPKRLQFKIMDLKDALIK